jgi:ubiquinone/menaquinone biosynthesis C-methylase UbiE
MWIDGPDAAERSGPRHAQTQEEAGMKGSGAFFDGFAVSFDGFYDSKRNRLMQWVNRTFRRDMYLRAELTFEFLGSLHGKRILDIGCGSGFYIANALSRGAQHVNGLDPAPGMLALARQRVATQGAEDRVRLIEGYFPEVVPPGPFDYAIVMGVLDYIEDPLVFLRELRRSIRVGAAVSFPSRHGFRTRLRQFRYRLRRCPVYFYTEERIRSLVASAGIPKCRVTKIPGAGMDYVACLEV